MQWIGPATEHEMVALFLAAEIHSERFGNVLLALLARDSKARKVIDSPDLTDKEENAYRIRLLGDFRGYRQQRELFSDFPKDVVWYRARLKKEELACVRYIDYSYWNALSGGSRLPGDAARNIRAGLVVYDVPNDRFWRAADAVTAGCRFPELILVGASEDSLTVLEGHLRLTAYLLAWESMPEELPVLIGISPAFAPVDRKPQKEDQERGITGDGNR